MEEDEEYERVFPDPSRRAEFWERFNALLNEFPEMLEVFNNILAGAMDERGILFDPDSPKFFQAVAIAISVRNVDHWESMFVIDPPEQSRYMTYGILQTAVDMQGSWSE